MGGYVVTLVYATLSEHVLCKCLMCKSKIKLSMRNLFSTNFPYRTLKSVKRTNYFNAKTFSQAWLGSLKIYLFIKLRKRIFRLCNYLVSSYEWWLMSSENSFC